MSEWNDRQRSLHLQFAHDEKMQVVSNYISAVPCASIAIGLAMSHFWWGTAAFAVGVALNIREVFRSHRRRDHELRRADEVMSEIEPPQFELPSLLPVKYANAAAGWQVFDNIRNAFPEVESKMPGSNEADRTPAEVKVRADMDSEYSTAVLYSTLTTCQELVVANTPAEDLFDGERLGAGLEARLDKFFGLLGYGAEAGQGISVFVPRPGGGQMQINYEIESEGRFTNDWVWIDASGTVEAPQSAEAQMLPVEPTGLPPAEPLRFADAAAAWQAIDAMSDSPALPEVGTAILATTGIDTMRANAATPEGTATAYRLVDAVVQTVINHLTEATAEDRLLAIGEAIAKHCIAGSSLTLNLGSDILRYHFAGDGVFSTELFEIVTPAPAPAAPEAVVQPSPPAPREIAS